MLYYSLMHAAPSSYLCPISVTTNLSNTTPLQQSTILDLPIRSRFPQLGEAWSAWRPSNLSQRRYRVGTPVAQIINLT